MPDSLISIGIILIITGVVFLVIAKIAGDYKDRNRPVTEAEVNTMLETWNEKSIALGLKQLQNQPKLFRHYVDSIKTRFVDNQNTRTAQSRIAFLEQQVKMLKLASEYSDVQNELSLKNKKYENELLRIDAENQNLRLGFKDEEAEKHIQELERERRRIQHELEIARLKNELEQIKNPAQPPKQLSREEAREKKREEIKNKIQKINEMIAETKNDAGLGENERQIKLNQYERKKFDLSEELIDLI